MKLTNKYMNEKALKVANNLAEIRGYSGLCHVDDPGLREWIWEKAEKRVTFFKVVSISLIGFIASLLAVFGLGLMIGTML